MSEEEKITKLVIKQPTRDVRINLGFSITKAKKAPAKKSIAKKAPAKKSVAKKAPAKNSAR